MARLYAWHETERDWIEASISTEYFGRYIRTKPVIAWRCGEDFYVIDRDGNKQTGRINDYIVVEEGFERVVPRGEFEATHHRVNPPIGDEQSELRALFAAILEQTLEGVETAPAPGPGDVPAWAFDAADAILAAIATMQ